MLPGKDETNREGHGQDDQINHAGEQLHPKTPRGATRQTQKLREVKWRWARQKWTPAQIYGLGEGYFRDPRFLDFSVDQVGERALAKKPAEPIAINACRYINRMILYNLVV